MSVRVGGRDAGWDDGYEYDGGLAKRDKGKLEKEKTGERENRRRGKGSEEWRGRVCEERTSEKMEYLNKKVKKETRKRDLPWTVYTRRMRQA